MGFDVPPAMLNLRVRCLRMLHPSTCPLCRKAFQPDRIKKLHVDRPPTANDDDDRTRDEEFELIQHVALFFGENTPDEDVNTVLGEAEDWLALQGDNPGSVSLPSLLVAWRSSGFLVGMVPSRRYDRLLRSFDYTASCPRCVVAHGIGRGVWATQYWWAGLCFLLLSSRWVAFSLGSKALQEYLVICDVASLTTNWLSQWSQGRVF